MNARGTFLTRQSRAVQRLWRSKQLVASLVSRNLKVKYKRSVLGFVWTLVNPLLTLVVLVSVFSYVLRVPIEDYWAFLLSGYFVWNFLGQTITSGTNVLTEHGPLSRAVAFPPEAPILAAALSRLVEFTIEMCLVLAVLTIFHHGHVPASYLLLPWLVLLQLVMALGLTFPIAALSVFYHDVQHAVPLLLATLFYVTPVFYALSLVPESVRPIFLINPIAWLMTLYQAAVYYGELPTPTQFLTTTAIAVGLLVVGYGVFNRYARFLAEVV